MLAGQHDLIDAISFENIVQVGAVEGAIETLRRHDFPLGANRRQFVNHVGAARAGHGVLAPDADFAIVGAMRVVGIDHQPIRLAAGMIDQAANSRDDAFGVVLVGQNAGHEIVEHVDDDKRFHIHKLPLQKNRRY